MPVCAPVSWQCRDFGPAHCLAWILATLPKPARSSSSPAFAVAWRPDFVHDPFVTTTAMSCAQPGIGNGKAAVNQPALRVRNRASSAVSKIATSPPSADRPGGVRRGTAAVAAALLPLMHRRIDRSGKPVFDPDVLSANPREYAQASLPRADLAVAEMDARLACPANGRTPPPKPHRSPRRVRNAGMSSDPKVQRRQSHSSYVAHFHVGNRHGAHRRHAQHPAAALCRRPDLPAPGPG